MADTPTQAEMIAYLEGKLGKSIDTIELTAGGQSVTLGG